MKLRNVLHLKKDDIHIIISLTPVFFYRVSNIMNEFMLYFVDHNFNDTMFWLKTRYSDKEYEEFTRRIEKEKSKLFIDDVCKQSSNIDLSKNVTTLTLNVTRKCNLNCNYCFENEKYRTSKQMSFITAKKAIDMFFDKQMSKRKIIFTGGEPMLNFELIKDIVQYIKTEKIIVEYCIKTNATLLDTDKIDYLIDNKFNIQVSLDGNEEAHNTHRVFKNGDGTFSYVNKILCELIEKNYGSKVTISGTLTHQTTKFVEESLQHLNSYKEIGNYELKAPMPNTDPKYLFNMEDFSQSYNANLKYAKNLVQKSKSFLSQDKKTNICGIGIWNITIDVDGKIYPCYRLCGMEEYLMGDIYSLRHPVQFKLPKDLVSIYELENNSNCSNCYLINICKTGCYADKLMSKMKGQDCIQPLRKVIENLLDKNLDNRDICMAIDII